MLKLHEGHCRRRKIRCVPSPNDVQGRCINCIRLKKECNFYPVDQQPHMDARQKSGSRSSVGPKIASASSSPAMPTGIPSDMHGQQTYSQMTIPGIQNMPPPMKPLGNENYPPDSKSKSIVVFPGTRTSHRQFSMAKRFQAPGTRPYEYGQQGVTNWMPADAGASSSKPSDMNAAWRSYSADSPITPGFSPYTPHAPPSSAAWSTSVGSETASRDDIAWSSYPAPPSRSLSFGADSMTSHQQYPPISQVTGHTNRSYDRKSSSVSTEMYPPPVATTIPGIETVPGTTLDQTASLSAGAVPPSSYASWQPQTYSYSKPGDGYGAWYGETATHQHLGSSDQHVSGHGNPSSNVFYGR